jgi:DNA modification methylase
MAEIEDGSVDMVLADPPYGTTACKWDSIIPLEPMWEQLKRVIKPNGAIVMTASQPFTTTLIASNMKMFKYCWVWEKENGGNFATANYQPLRVHEDILVWGNFATSYRVSAIKRYNPQLTKGKAYSCVSGSPKNSILHGGKMQKEGGNVTVNKGTRHPRSIIKFNRDKGLHPTQKPVALMEYLIKTYTNEGETVLDFTMGSGTTGVACANLNRDFIGIEKDLDYFNIALTRIEEAVTANACSV